MVINCRVYVCLVERRYEWLLGHDAFDERLNIAKIIAFAHAHRVANEGAMAHKTYNSTQHGEDERRIDIWALATRSRHCQNYTFNWPSLKCIGRGCRAATAPTHRNLLNLLLQWKEFSTAANMLSQPWKLKTMNVEGKRNKWKTWRMGKFFLLFPLRQEVVRVVWEVVATGRHRHHRPVPNECTNRKKILWNMAVNRQAKWMRAQIPFSKSYSVMSYTHIYNITWNHCPFLNGYILCAIRLWANDMKKLTGRIVSVGEWHVATERVAGGWAPHMRTTWTSCAFDSPNQNDGHHLRIVRIACCSNTIRSNDKSIVNSPFLVVYWRPPVCKMASRSIPHRTI